MKFHTISVLRALLLAVLLLCTLSGCSLFPSLAPEPAEDRAPAALELHLGSALPEDIILTWNADAVTVDSAEIAVAEDGAGLPRTVTVTIRLDPCQP